MKALEQMVSRATTAPGGPAGTVHYIHGLDGALLAEADGATGQVLRDYIWLPEGDAAPAADNDNEEGGSSPPLPIALVTGAGTPAPQLLMVHADHLGRPIRLTDAARATVWSASYDPFGQPVTVTGAVEQNLRFPGQYFLIETGLSYNWHRFYDPATGRYTQPDPLRFVDGPSVYAYAGQSPMMRVDPEGRQTVPRPIPLPWPIFPWPGRGPEPWVPGRPFPTSPGGGLPTLPPLGALPLGPIVPLLPMCMSDSSGGSGDNDGGERCRVVKTACFEFCDLALDNDALPDLQSMYFHRCVAQCLSDNNCNGGIDYNDQWDQGKIGSPRPWNGKKWLH